MSTRRTRWSLHFAIAAIVAIAAHALTVWTLPRVIMDRIITLGGGDAAKQGDRGVFLPPPTDHTQRRIVMPSPDLLYATCAYDLSSGPLKVTLTTDYPRYWSIALYGSNSDNFFVINDRAARKGRVNLTVVDAATKTMARDDTVISPTTRGFLLMRLLVNGDPEVLASAERARRGLRCETVRDATSKS